MIKPFKNPLLFIFIFGIFSCAPAIASSHPGQDKNAAVSPGIRYKNAVKFSITAPVFKNFAVQYERALSKRFSIAVTYRGMPENNIAFVDHLERYIENDEVDFENIRNMRLKSSVITPEIRIYTGSKGTRGFYIAPYASFASHHLKTPAFIFEKTEDDGSSSTLSLPMSGSVNSISAGLMLGSQFNLGKRFTLDWWIIGASIGKGNGKVEALSGMNIGEDWQEEIRYALEQVDIPYFKYETQVNENGATLKIDGPWAGLRGGLSLGFRF